MDIIDYAKAVIVACDGLRAFVFKCIEGSSERLLRAVGTYIKPILLVLIDVYSRLCTVRVSPLLCEKTDRHRMIHSACRP